VVEDKPEKEEMLVEEANEINYMWHEKEEKRLEELYKDEINSD
jgi:hypothetical protein